MSPLGATAQARLFRRIGTSLDAGVDIRRVMQQEGARGSAKQQSVMQNVSMRLDKGDTLTEAFKESDGAFPPLVCEMVAVGERTGKLEQVFVKLADHFDFQLSLRRTFLTGITMPAIQLTVAVIVIGGFIWFMGQVAEPGSRAANVLGPGMSGTPGLIRYLGIVAVLFGAPALLATAMVKGWIPAAPIWAVLIRVPVLGPCIKSMALSRFTWSLAMALNSGMDAKRCMHLAQRSTNNAYYMSGVRRVGEVIDRGGEMHEALRKTGLYPEELLDAIENAEHAGKEIDTLMRMSRDYREKAQTSMGVLVTVASFVVWALVAGIIIFFIVRLFMALYLGPINDALDMMPGR